MEEFFKNVSSQGWWFSVVFVGVLVNLLSTYLLRRMEKAGLSFSQWMRNRSEKKKKNFQLQVEVLVDRPDRIPVAFAREARLRSRAIQYMLETLLFWAFTALATTSASFAWVGGVMAALSMLGFLRAQQLQQRADQLAEAIAEAQERLEEKRGSLVVEAPSADRVRF
jgi:positive regulator of sigma E activity